MTRTTQRIVKTDARTRGKMASSVPRLRRRKKVVKPRCATASHSAQATPATSANVVACFSVNILVPAIFTCRMFATAASG